MPKQVTIPNTLTLGSCEFAAAEPRGDGQVARAPCRMVARSGQAVTVQGFGPVIHDFAGMRTLASRLNVDFCHRPEELIGFCEDVDVSEGDLKCTASIFSVHEKDRAAEVMARAKEGQPYQCSIKWDDGVVEPIAKGQNATVNGREVTGPGLIVREWTLRGIAVCPYGVDPHTSAEFSARPQQSSFTFDVEEAEPMADTEAPVTTTTPPAEESHPDHRAEMKAELQSYVTMFGGELGAKWFAEGKDQVQCYGEYVGTLQTRHAGELAAVEAKAAKLETTVTELTSRIASLGDAGGTKIPASNLPAADGQPGAKTAGEYSSVLPDNLARVAAGIKMPH